MASKLPDTNQRWWQLAAIQLVGATSLPIILLGKQIIPHITLLSYLVGVVVGNAILWGLGVCIVIMAEHRRLHIVQLSRHYFLRTGAFATALAVLISGVMWFTLQLHAASSAIVHLVTNRPAEHSALTVRIGVVLGILASFLGLLGIRGIKWISCAFVPILLAYLFVFIFTNFHLSAFPSAGPVFSLRAIALVVAAGLVATISFPTFFRHSRSRQHSITAITIIFIIVALVETAGLLLLSHVQQDQVWLPIHVGLDTFPYSSGVWLAFLVISSVIVNLENTYLASVGWEILVPRIVGRKEYLIISLGGTLFYVLVQQHTALTSVSLIGNVVIASMGSTMAACYIINRLRSQTIKRIEKQAAIIIWWVGVIAGLTISTEASPLKPDPIAASASVSTLLMIIYQILRGIRQQPLNDGGGS